MRPSLMRNFGGTRKLNYYGMFKHNLLITLRGFLRYKNSFLINLIGLSTGLACTLLIYLWVNDELQVDKFHTKDDQLYSVMGNQHTPEGINTWNGTPAPLALALENEFPEIERAVASTDPAWNMTFSLSANDKKLKSVGKYVSQGYFELFSYDLVKGNIAEALSDKSAIVISDKLAQKLFKDNQNIIGEPIQWESASDKRISKVTGVFKAPPASSTDQFDFLLPFDIYLSEQQNWYAPISITHVLLSKEANLAVINAKIKDFMTTKVEESEVTLFLERYSNAYLYGNYENGVQVGGRIQYVKLFSIIACFILLIACINFMNLSTARGSRRVKELGVKKASGATRGNLITQYLSESVLMSFIALLFALMMVYLALPAFNQLTDKTISLSFDQQILFTSIAITFLVGLVSGSYPAFYLSGFSPAGILKGTLKSSAGEAWIRKGLVVFQFSISILLIVSVFVVYKQVEFVQDKHLGYNKDNLILFENNGKISENFDTFMNELKNIPGVVNASGMTNGMFGAPGGELSWNGTSSSNFSRFIVHYDFIETLGLSIEEGQAFSNVPCSFVPA
ncbi:MAG: ABC transporter permease [Ekhidna sp.]|nr:ABC transporter permease [Ekhidna sp.]